MLLVRFGILALLLSVGVGLAVTTSARMLFPQRFQTAPRRRRLWRAALAAVLVALATEVLGRLYAPLGGGLFRLPIAAERTLFLVCWFALPGLLAARFLGALAGRLEKPRALPPAEDAATPSLSRREAIERGLAVASVGVASGAAALGGLRERHDLQVTDVSVTLPDLPPSLEGLTIVHLTDLHVGIFTGKRELDRLVERVRALRPDLVVITGDVLDNNPAHVPDGMRALGCLRAPLGVYASLGNHDHTTGPDAVTRGMAAVGIVPLVNAAVPIVTDRTRRESLTLAGVEDIWAVRRDWRRVPDLERALRGTDPEAPRVLLAHNPVYLRAARGRVALQLSGHTHGGQINIGGLPDLLLPFVAGRYAADGTVLYVSRGIGITGPPVRLAAAPEIARIGLTSRRA